MTAQPEITTAAERQAGTAEAEPLLTFSQLQALLREAAAIERAQRPIVIRPAAEAFPAPVAAQPAPAPAMATGTAVTLASAPEAPQAPARRREPTRGGWGLRLVYGSLTTLLAGAADGIVVGTAPVPVTACALGIIGIIAGTARAITEQDREQGGVS